MMNAIAGVGEDCSGLFTAELPQAIAVGPNCKIVVGPNLR